MAERIWPRAKTTPTSYHTLKAPTLGLEEGLARAVLAYEYSSRLHTNLSKKLFLDAIKGQEGKVPAVGPDISLVNLGHWLKRHRLAVRRFFKRIS